MSLGAEVYLPRADDPDHQYHGAVGEGVDVFEDDLSDVTGNPERGYLYTVAFDNSELESTDFCDDDLPTPD